MTHLSTIIDRVKRREHIYGEDIKGLLNDTIFHQNVANLYEYQENWTDATTEEKAEADKLFNKYYPLLKDKDRLKDISY